MLSKKDRVPRRLFKDILRKGTSVHSAHLSLRFAHGPNRARVAVSISKKVAKSAVARNTFRRRAYSALRPRLAGLKNGLYLFAAKPGADKLRGEKLSTELGTLLKGL
jgi:ribonuclease P protein component